MYMCTLHQNLGPGRRSTRDVTYNIITIVSTAAGYIGQSIRADPKSSHHKETFFLSILLDLSEVMEC